MANTHAAEQGDLILSLRGICKNFGAVSALTEIDLDVHAGGSTSVDITKKGIDKAYGIARLAEILDLDPAEILFVGDRLTPGGNDYPVLRLGVQTHAVRDWTDTLEFLRRLLPTLRS